MPLELTDQEKDLLLELAMPIAYGQRPQFLREVAAALEDCPQSQNGPSWRTWRAPGGPLSRLVA
jgi:hypothetical protein